MSILCYQNSLLGYEIDNIISRTIFENHNALISCAAPVDLQLVFQLVFFWLVAPANAGFLAATLPSIPLNWTDLRSNWETGHAIRFTLQFAALALLALSLLLDVNDVNETSGRIQPA